MTRPTDSWFEDLALQASVLKKRLTELEQQHPRWEELKASYEMATALDQFEDDWAQAVICGSAAMSILESSNGPAVWRAFPHSNGQVVLAALNEAARFPRSRPPAAAVDPTYFYERFLDRYDLAARNRHGVFYTPPSVVRFVVEALDRSLRDSFSLSNGLADTSTWRDLSDRIRLRIPCHVDPDEPFVRVLDPAVGTGAFLAEVVRSIHQNLNQQWDRARKSIAEKRASWNDYVERYLLRRVVGIDISLPALVLAHLNLANTLASTGYQAAPSRPFELLLADALRGPTAELRNSTEPADDPTACPATVLLGNPPFSGISANRGEWIRNLLRGRDVAGKSAASYFEVDGRKLGERKSWLQDDYVKFFRYAQWKIEQVGTGAVGLITNHGYLDNTTFRGMRAALLETFPLATIVDLHGNRKKHEAAPDRMPDENIFDIEQGVAVGIYARPPVPTQRCVRFGELWGDRPSKLRALDANATELSVIDPVSPHFFLVPTPCEVDAVYTRGFRLNEVMPVNSTAVVTARDRVVIGESELELEERLRRLRDLAIPDEEIRATMFTNGRSRRYPPGDTRGWKLAEARRRLAEQEEWEQLITSCLYRPFDRRRIFWADWMVDWPRPEVMRHMAGGRNLALVARRQMLPTQPCSFFWISDCITIDGVIRSDNRGSESVFPLYLSGSSETVNFTSEFLDSVAQRYGWDWSKTDRGDLVACFGPVDLLHYIYALFHSPAYRERYSAQLRIDFPRILLPNSAKLFRDMCGLGQRLVAAHTESATADPAELPDIAGPPPARIGVRFPRFRDSRIEFSDQSWLEGISEEVWHFRVGGYQVCRKWIRDRRRRGLTEQDYRRYQLIVSTLQQTLDWMKEIDLKIEAAGSWPAAFDR